MLILHTPSHGHSSLYKKKHTKLNTITKTKSFAEKMCLEQALELLQ